MQHAIRCQCGALKGVLVRTGQESRLICYCKDCQAFANFLKPGGDILDAAGGTDLVQTEPKQLTFSQGREHLACMRLSEKGMMRWYASCCNTPIGNTAATGKVAFVGLIHNCLAQDGQSLAEAFGPVIASLNGESAQGEPKPKNNGLFTVIVRAIKMIGKGRLTGSYKQSPFFRAATDTPVAAPKILTATERQALAAIG